MNREPHQLYQLFSKPKPDYHHLYQKYRAKYHLLKSRSQIIDKMWFDTNPETYPDLVVDKSDCGCL